MTSVDECTQARIKHTRSFYLTRWLWDSFNQLLSIFLPWDHLSSQVTKTGAVFVLYQRNVGREPWSSGYGRRLTFQRSWVRIPAPDTGWTFFTLICCKNCIVCLKRPKINEKKEAEVGPFKKNDCFVINNRRVGHRFTTLQHWTTAEYFIAICSNVEPTNTSKTRFVHTYLVR